MNRKDAEGMPPGKRPDPTQPQTRTPLTKETPGSRRAATIVDLVRRELSADFSELSHALTLLKPQAVCESGGPSTDGEHYFYDPEWVIERARTEGYSCGAIRASMLHVVFHGLLGHFAEHVKYQRRNWVWDVMDLQVHEMMLEIGEGYYTDYTWDDREKLGGIHDYGLYYEACRSREIRREMKRRAKYIRLDDHRVWPVDYDRDRPMDGAPMSGAGAKARTQVIAMRWEEARELLLKAGGGMQDLMKNLVSVLITDRKGTGYGTGAGAGQMNCKEIRDPSADYTQRLREFMQVNEQVKETDSIDPMLYEYGMQLYEDMPLIEPLEVCEDCDLKSIVLAIDTSGSCAGAAGRFLGETNQLFEDIGTVGRIRKLHYLECDADIQKELVFDSAQSLKQVECRTMYGWGGTDFRPVFERASEYQRDGEEISLLIYLTDGDGPYPESRPEYPVWFVMPKQDYEVHKRSNGYRELPDWITLLCLNE